MPGLSPRLLLGLEEKHIDDLRGNKQFCDRAGKKLFKCGQGEMHQIKTVMRMSPSRFKLGACLVSLIDCRTIL